MSDTEKKVEKTEDGTEINFISTVSNLKIEEMNPKIENEKEEKEKKEEKEEKLDVEEKKPDKKNEKIEKNEINIDKSALALKQDEKNDIISNLNKEKEPEPKKEVPPQQSKVKRYYQATKTFFYNSWQKVKNYNYSKYNIFKREEMVECLDAHGFPMRLPKRVVYPNENVNSNNIKNVNKK